MPCFHYNLYNEYLLYCVRFVNESTFRYFLMQINYTTKNNADDFNQNRHKTLHIATNQTQLLLLAFG